MHRRTTVFDLGAEKNPVKVNIFLDRKQTGSSVSVLRVKEKDAGRRLRVLPITAGSFPRWPTFVALDFWLKTNGFETTDWFLEAMHRKTKGGYGDQFWGIMLNR